MAQDFNQLIQSETPVLVDFFATWCGPCKMMTPILSELKEKIGEKATLVKIDVDKNNHLASIYKVQSVPTIIIFKKGNVVWRNSGVVQANQLKQILEKFI